MFNCVARPSSSFDNNDPFMMNQSPSSLAPFGQLPSSMNSTTKLDLVNGVGNYNHSTAASSQALPPFHRFTPGPQNNSNNFFQQTLAQFRNATATPLGFNDNEFPSLTMGNNRGSAGFGGMGSFGQFRTGIGFGRAGYASLMKQQASVDRAQPEFQIQNEDFPALPKAQNDITSITGKRGDTPISNASAETSKVDRLSMTDGVRPEPLHHQQQQQQQQQAPPTYGIQTHPNGMVTNIPPSLLNDQFGMAGLLTFIRAVQTESAVVSLALGQDLTKLGVNLNVPEKNLYQYFGGPWADQPCRPQDIDCQVPPEYVTYAAISETLAPIKLNRYGEDLLFYLFYNFGGEMFQLAAAAELYNRDWRYHKEERLWIARAPGVEPLEKTAAYEKGTYYIFDPGSWRKISKEMILEYAKLEDRPMLPPQQQQISQSAPGQLPFGLSSGMHNS